MEFPPEYLDLLSDEKPALLYLATVMPDGSPQVTPIWFSTDGEHILINTAEGRIKDRNMRQRPKIAAVIQDPGDPYRYLQVRGSIVDRTYEGALEHINRLSLKYDHKPWIAKPDQKRVLYKIKAEHFDLH